MYNDKKFLFICTFKTRGKLTGTHPGGIQCHCLWSLHSYSFLNFSFLNLVFYDFDVYVIVLIRIRISPDIVLVS